VPRRLCNCLHVVRGSSAVQSSHILWGPFNPGAVPTAAIGSPCDRAVRRDAHHQLRSLTPGFLRQAGAEQFVHLVVLAAAIGALMGSSLVTDNRGGFQWLGGRSLVISGEVKPGGWRIRPWNPPPAGVDAAPGRR
jgi:hypothetical protein